MVQSHFLGLFLYPKPIICLYRKLSFTLKLDIPANIEAEVWMPRLTDDNIDYVKINNMKIQGQPQGNFIVLNVGSGNYRITYELEH